MRRRIDRVQTGRVRFQRTGTTNVDWRDLYHSILTLTWPQFAAWILGLYLIFNMVMSNNKHRFLQDVTNYSFPRNGFQTGGDQDHN